MDLDKIKKQPLGVKNKADTETAKTAFPRLAT